MTGAVNSECRGKTLGASTAAVQQRRRHGETREVGESRKLLGPSCRATNSCCGMALAAPPRNTLQLRAWDQQGSG